MSKATDALGADLSLGATLPGSFQVTAPAKINLYLRVGRLASDGAYAGFHPLLSWMVTIGLFDTLTFSPRQSAATAPGTAAVGGAQSGADDDLIRLSCETSPAPGMPALACDRSNLIVRAGMALAEAIDAARGPRAPGTKPSGQPPHNAATREEKGKEIFAASARLSPMAVTLEKRIPLGGGLGGGSSDAAAALRGLCRLWQVDPGERALAEIALRLGSDVPFFLGGPSSICRGRGEIIHPTPAPKVARWAVIFLPPRQMPTPEVYRRFDEMHLGTALPGDGQEQSGKEQTGKEKSKETGLNPGTSAGASADTNFATHVAARPSGIDADIEAWAALPSAQLMGRLVNDLEWAAFSISPRLGLLRRELEQRLGRAVRMSGSGSSLFTLFDTAEQAQIACRRVLQKPLRRLEPGQALRALAAEVAPAISA